MKPSKIEIIQLEDKADNLEALRRSAYLLSIALEELAIEAEKKLAKAKAKKKSKR